MPKILVIGDISIFNASLPVDWADRGDGGHKSSADKLQKQLADALSIWHMLYMSATSKLCIQTLKQKTW